MHYTSAVNYVELKLQQLQATSRQFFYSLGHGEKPWKCFMVGSDHDAGSFRIKMRKRYVSDYCLSLPIFSILFLLFVVQSKRCEDNRAIASISCSSRSTHQMCLSQAWASSLYCPFVLGRVRSNALMSAPFNDTTTALSFHPGNQDI